MLPRMRRFVWWGLGLSVVLASALGVTCLACSGGDGEGSSSGGSSASSGGTSSGGSSSGASSTSSGGSSGAADEGLLPDSSVWRKTSEWYRRIDTAPVAEPSAEMISAIKTWGKADIFQIDFSFDVLDATGGSPTTFPPGEETDDVPVPVPAKGWIEGDHDYGSCPDGDDCHLLVVDRAGSRLYEVYEAHQSSGSWTGSLAMWKLDKTYPRSNRGQGCTSADAAGLPITPGLIGYRETKKGTIAHALRFIIQNDWIRGVAGDRNTPNVAYPASHGSTAGASANGVPYGARLRLKASVADDDPRAKTPGAKAVLRALKTYGMILADGGNIPLVAESVKPYADANASETWDGLLGARDLAFLRPGDFEVIAIPKADPSQPDAGWYQSKADYVGQLQKPLGCVSIVQP